MNRNQWKAAWRMVRANRGAVLQGPPLAASILLPAARALMDRELYRPAPKNRYLDLF